MAWIDIIPLKQASGLLKRLYDGMISSTDRWWQVVAVQGLNPASMRAAHALFNQVMYGDSPLCRGRRELLATVVAAENQCLY